MEPTKDRMRQIIKKGCLDQIEYVADDLAELASEKGLKFQKTGEDRGTFSNGNEIVCEIRTRRFSSRFIDDYSPIIIGEYIPSGVIDFELLEKLGHIKQY